MQVYSLEGDTLDAVVFRHLGTTAGIVEQILADHPGLADLGAILPTGTRITLPDTVNTVSASQFIQLWD